MRLTTLARSFVVIALSVSTLGLVSAHEPSEPATQPSIESLQTESLQRQIEQLNIELQVKQVYLLNAKLKLELERLRSRDDSETMPKGSRKIPFNDSYFYLVPLSGTSQRESAINQTK